MSDVGCVFTFEVDPRNDRETEQAMRAIFDAMAAEEFPGGDVKTYTVYRDPATPGKWIMFEQFTNRGSDNHASGSQMQGAGRELASQFTAPFTRTILEPVFYAGCGTSINERWP